MMVIMIASTPSLKASRRLFDTATILLMQQS
jgi:hypothetical protein